MVSDQKSTVPIRRKKEKKGLSSTAASKENTTLQLNSRKDEDGFQHTVFRWDEEFSKKAYMLGSENKILKVITLIINITSDEALWFGSAILSIFLGFGAILFSENFTALFNVYASDKPIIFEFGLEVFGTISVCVVLESFFKSIFKRSRPYYKPKKSGPWNVYGEWWSFPSGHTIRGFYLYSWLVHSSILKYITSIDASSAWHVLLAWSIWIGAARVFAGKHHIVDVLFGAVIGFCLGIFMYEKISEKHQCGILALSELNIGAQFWFMLIQPELKKIGLNSVVINLVKITFYFPGLFLMAWHTSAQYITCSNFVTQL